MKSYKWNDELTAKLIDMYRNDATLQDIATEFESHGFTRLAAKAKIKTLIKNGRLERRRFRESKPNADGLVQEGKKWDDESESRSIELYKFHTNLYLVYEMRQLGFSKASVTERIRMLKKRGAISKNHRVSIEERKVNDRAREIVYDSITEKSSGTVRKLTADEHWRKRTKGKHLAILAESILGN